MLGKFDYRIILFVLVTFLTSVIAGLAIVFVFRAGFPQIAEKTFIEELLGLAGGSTIAYIGKKIAVFQHLFHMLIVNDLANSVLIRIEIERREGWKETSIFPEAIVFGKEHMVRNIAWWGIRGIDTCKFYFYAEKVSSGAFLEKYLVEVPRGLCKPYQILRVSLSSLIRNKTYLVRKEDVMRRWRW